MEDYRPQPPPGEGSSAEEIWQNTPRVAVITLVISVVAAAVALLLWLVGVLSGLIFVAVIVMAAAFGLRMLYGFWHFVRQRSRG